MEPFDQKRPLYEITKHTSEISDSDMSGLIVLGVIGIELVQVSISIVRFIDISCCNTF